MRSFSIRRSGAGFGEKRRARVPARSKRSAGQESPMMRRAARKTATFPAEDLAGGGFTYR